MNLFPLSAVSRGPSAARRFLSGPSSLGKTLVLACKWLATSALLLVLSACGDADLDWRLTAVPPVALKLPGLEQAGEEPILALTADMDPVTKPAFKHVKRDFFECKGLLGAWYQKIIVAEINFLAKQHELMQIANPVCLISVDKSVGLNGGRFKVHLYMDMEDLKECEMNLRCKWARNVGLVLKNKAVYRSYFLSDFKNDKYYQHCVSPDSQWFARTTCYTMQ
ncbi:MAG: hypothetical protein RIT44_1834 [Pseudomonadota bacterium]